MLNKQQKSHDESTNGEVSNKGLRNGITKIAQIVLQTLGDFLLILTGHLNRQHRDFDAPKIAKNILNFSAVFDNLISKLKVKNLLSLFPIWRTFIFEDPSLQGHSRIFFHNNLVQVKMEHKR